MQHQLNRLDVKLEVCPLFPGVLHLFFRTRHVGFITTIGAGHLACTVAQRGTYTVHGRIASAQNHHVQSGGIDKLFFRQLIQPHHLLGVGNQERQRIIYAWRVFIWQVRLHGTIGSHPHEHGIVILQQLFKCDVFTHFTVKFEMNPHSAEDFTATRQQRFVQFEGRNTERQQTANFRMAIVNGGTDTATRQHIRAGQARRTRADNGNTLVHFLHMA